MPSMGLTTSTAFGDMWTEIDVYFDGTNIAGSMQPFLTSLTYTDYEEDQADDMQIKLHDANGIWVHHWLTAVVNDAAAGTTKGLAMLVHIWMGKGPGRYHLHCGDFEMDTVQTSGPPGTVTIKGTALPWGVGIRTVERSKAWVSYKLSEILAEMCGRAGLTPYYDAPDDPFYDRVEQSSQTDIAFLEQLCKDSGKSLKCVCSRIVIFDEAEYESRAAIMTISWMDGTYTKYQLGTQEGETHYAMCKVSYYDAEKKKTYKGEYKAEDYDDLKDEAKENILTVTDRRVTSDDEAKAMAMHMLRLYNKFERTAEFTMVGNPLIGSGLTCYVSGFGLWDGKYMISEAVHKIDASGGYTTKIKLRNVLGY